MRATLLTAWTDQQDLGDVTPLEFAATADALSKTEFMGSEFEGDPEKPEEVSVQINLDDGTVQFYCGFASE